MNNLKSYKTIVLIGLAAIIAITLFSKWFGSDDLTSPEHQIQPQLDHAVETPSSGNTLVANDTAIQLKAGKESAAESAPRLTVTPAEEMAKPLDVEDADRTEPGEEIYTMKTVPNQTGTYWVRDSNGDLQQLAICNDDSESLTEN